MPFQRFAPIALLAIMLATPASADVITDWNTIWLDCIRATGGPPCPIARAGAMVHAAVYDAVNSVDRKHQPYLANLPFSRPCSAEAAAAAAAHDVLVYLYPSRRAILDADLDASLAGFPNRRAKANGVALGMAAANAIIVARLGDGSDDATPYPVGSAPGDWRPTPPDFGNPASPNWGHVRPFVISSGAQFRPLGPMGDGMGDVHSILVDPRYADYYNDVKEIGSRTSLTRTAYQTQTAYFWANDVNGTYKPPGHLNTIAQALSAGRHLSLAENARLFALLNLALGDAGIVAWDCKYDAGVDLWRPITGIRLGATDDNPLTVADPAWEPLNAFTPPFPAYISGHATFASTAAAIFTGYFGTDYFAHTIGTDEPLYTGGPRTYSSFIEEARENGRSRIYLGVHWQFDADDGIQAGTSLGQYVYANILNSVHGNENDGDQFGPGGPVLSYDGLGVRVGSETPIAAASLATIEYDLALAGPVRIAVLDLQGRRVAMLAEGFESAGHHSRAWDGRDSRGVPAVSGIYFARVESGGKIAVGRIAIAR